MSCPMDADTIEVVNQGEVLLLRARAMAHRIKAQVGSVLARHSLPVLQRPGPVTDLGSPHVERLGKSAGRRLDEAAFP
jgi:hypothetical protein